MKKLLLYLNLLLLLFSLHTQGQEKEAQARAKNNIAKINLSSTLFKTACVQYERILSNKLSVTANIIYRPKEIFAPAFVETSWYFSNEQLSVFAFTPALRYYFGKKAGQGFYNEVYFRYRRDALHTNTTPSAFTNGTFFHTGHEQMFNAGILIGYQLYKKNNLVLDLWFLGLGIGLQVFHLIQNLNAEINSVL